MGIKLTKEIIKKKLLDDGNGFILTGIYSSYGDISSFMCKNNHEFTSTLRNILYGKQKSNKCNECARIEAIKIINNKLTNEDITLVGKFISSNKKADFECINGHIFNSKVSKVVSEGTRCPKCLKEKQIETENYRKKRSIRGKTKTLWIGSVSHNNITQEYLKNCVIYNHNNGEFIRIQRPLNHFKNIKAFDMYNARFVGNIATIEHVSGYLKLELDSFSYQAHRLAWLYCYGEMPKNQIDHINGIKNDNRICNLREATNSQNQQNLYNAQADNKSGFLGVSLRGDNGKYRAAITLNKKTYNLGTYATPEEAHKSYVKAKRKLHEYGKL